MRVSYDGTELSTIIKLGIYLQKKNSNNWYKYKTIYFAMII